jgi:hypothetical protein
MDLEIRRTRDGTNIVCEPVNDFLKRDGVVVVEAEKNIKRCVYGHTHIVVNGKRNVIYSYNNPMWAEKRYSRILMLS